MIIPVDNIVPGMTVACDVINVNGAVMLTAGTELSPQYVRRLKMWGIETVEVRGEPAGGRRAEPAPQPAPELEQAALARVNHRLKHVALDLPAAAHIRTLALRRTAARMGRAAQEHTGHQP